MPDALSILYNRLSEEEKKDFREAIQLAISETLKNHRPDTYTASDTEWAFQTTYARTMRKVRYGRY